ncbi:MAG: aromatic ring-hydroxylating dioxygenase subunit alpha [Hyphomicrobiales bacterium]|nr:aromatic ring-hydroxylating dioxygenase subunit alpha [Hyphomicrobiales bacterium]MDE2017025.1 aromatic ring-hydroxylating dioxygenase subunit alpha [Hyphomicrobiales bacterium]
MTKHADPNLGALVRARRAGRSLPAALYTGAEAFEADCATFFERQWTLVAVEADVPSADGTFVVDFARASVVLARGDDGALRGFHNVCRHRGARLRDAGKATGRRITCPYHHWTYGLDGALIRAPHMGTDFDASCHGLRPVHLRTVGGLVFVSLADGPPADFADLEAAMGPRLAPYGLARAKIAHESVIVEEGNWKLTMENNRECYHCAGSHPELGKTFLPQDFGYDPDELSPAKRAVADGHLALFARKTRAWEEAGWPSAPIEHLVGHDTNFRTERLMMGEGGVARSATMDGKPACRVPLGDVGDADVGDLHFWTHHSWHHLMADHAVVTMAHPISPERTRVRTVWLVNAKAREGVDYDRENLVRVWTATNSQDAALVARAQAGVRTPGYSPGPYSRFTERHLDDFATWYVDRLLAAGH